MPRKLPNSAYIANLLLSGGIVLLPTDTVYGLAVSPIFPDSVKKVYSLKMRPLKKNLPIMVASESEILQLGVQISSQARKLLDSSLTPGALTFIFGFINEPLVPWLSGREEIAVRIPNHDSLLTILSLTGPLLVTSANKFGQQTPENVPDILKQLNGKPDLIIDGGILETTSSTIINCRHKSPKIEREGKINYSIIKEVLGV